MSAPAEIAAGARKRIQEKSEQIRHSLQVIQAGCPGDAETDPERRQDVLQLRTRTTVAEARRLAPQSGPEAIWGQTIDFVDVTFFERGRQAARSVCRIISRNGQPIGTGFLISPRVIITNNHVIESALAAGSILAEFDYERQLDGTPRPVTRFALDPATLFLTSDRDDLDYTVVALGARDTGNGTAPGYRYLPLSGARNKHVLGDLANIIQHPDGRMKEAVVRENQLVSRGNTVLHYVTDTEPGSSGSPVFNGTFTVVALHHWGGPHRGLVDEKGVKVPRTVNEGIRISAIVADLQTRKATLAPGPRTLVEEALTLGVEDQPAAAPDEATGGGDRAPGLAAASGGVTVSTDGTATWQIPLTVSVRLGAGATAASAAAAAATDGAAKAGPAADSGQPAGEAKLVLDEHYENRDGYQPDFLGGPDIAMPALSAAQRKLAARNQEAKPGENQLELKYEHFSIVMNGKRRLAFFTATNIDGASSKDFDRDSGKITDPLDEGLDDEGAEATEQWFVDRRIDAAEQTPSNLFQKQKVFDADGNVIEDHQSSDFRNRMFQQGHLTRRQDPLWGDDDQVIIRANSDTFHVTNRAPQVGYFNMGIRKRGEEAKHAGGTLYWRALEEYVLANARADRQRVTVFTGPVLDDANDFPWSRKRADLKGFKAPRAFWKVVLRREQGELHATALLADQSPLIDNLPEALDLDAEELKQFSFSKVKKYQVSIAELQQRTGLDFGKAIHDADTYPAGESRIRLMPADNLEDVTLELPHSRGRRRASGGTVVGRGITNGHGRAAAYPRR
ncbi:MAG TPA: DNA/RNA non-specific endonuclease [Gemmatimonadales bacterium]|nr:DNA/RNA non-specific endonuclease [Gemmatimonadales bacterium]